MITSETRFVARYAETDQMGIVHHSNYPIWYEAGRTDFIRTLGISYTEIESRGLLLPLIELKCTFKSAARYEDRIVVKTQVKEMTKTRIVFLYTVYKDTGEEPINIGETYHVWTDKSLKPVNLMKYEPAIYEVISKAL